MTQQLFVWCRGQDDNVGDTILRRAMLDAVRRRGTLHVLTGSGSTSYVDGLALRPQDVAYRSRGAWLARLYLETARRRAALFFNPGEVRVGLQTALTHAMLLPVQLAARSHRLGVAVVPGSRRLALPLRWSVRLASRNVWRDTHTPTWLPGSVAPDWGFALGGDDAPGRSRTSVAMTFRSDRPEPPAQLVEAVTRVCAERNLTLYTYAQVRRDREPMRSLAERLGIEYRDWPDGVPHLEFESLLRDWLRGTELVVSDRLHALVVAMTEGAVPAGFMGHDDHKVRTHLAVVGAEAASRDVRTMTSEQIGDALEALLDQRASFAELTEAARRDVRLLLTDDERPAVPHRGGQPSTPS